MADKITFQELIDEFSEKSGRTKAFSNQFIKDVFTTIQEGLRKDENVNIKGLGIFKLQEVAERETLNPKTGLSSLIEAHKKIVFRPEKALRERVNEKYAGLEPQVIGKKEEKTESTPSQANIPTFPIPEERPKQDLTNNKPITSSITNEDGSIDIKKIFGGDDLPSDEALQKENPLIGSEILSVDNKSDAEKFKEQGAQSLDELIKKTSNSESGTSEPKKEEELKINFEGKTEPQVFGDEKKTDEPDLSDNLPWLKKETESSRSEENTDSKISPTFIIEKRQKKSAWRWIFPLVFVILIIAVIFLVPNNSIKIEDIAFWKNWEKISLFERKDKDKLDEKEQVIAENQDQDKGEKDTSSKKIENVFMKLKNMNNQENVDTKITEDKVKSNEIKTITQSSSDESYLIHIVQPGNTLWGLSNYYYKRSSLWPNIYRKNIEILPTPDFLPLGRKLLIPELRGESYHLSKADSARIAQGYYLAYTAYKKYDENKAKGYLEMSKKFGTTIK